MVKNREAAQLFRQRQKAYIQDLEKKVADLSATNNIELFGASNHVKLICASSDNFVKLCSSMSDEAASRALAGR